jgi:hypothetical protein
MQIDAPNLTIMTDLYTGSSAAAAQGEVGVAVLRKVMDAAEDKTLSLLQSLQPHLGQNLDVRL